MSARYTYGDSDRSAERLGLLASMFAPASEAFMRDLVPAAPAVAIDLGCGPGFTTRSLHHVTEARTTLGVDRSTHFLGLAAQAAPPGVAFVAADAEHLPMRSVDVIYARLLLAHLPDPMATLGRWSTRLTIDGRILVDDLEAIETGEGTFRTYLDEVALPVVKRGGGSLFVGPMLGASEDPARLTRVQDQVVLVEPDPMITARVFALNLAELTARGETPARPDLESALTEIGNEGSTSPIRWRMRQLAWELRSPREDHKRWTQGDSNP